MIEGKIAGLAVARDLTGIDLQADLEKMQKELVEFRSGPFSDKVRKGLERFFPQSAHSYSKDVQQDLGPTGKLRPIIECFEKYTV